MEYTAIGVGALLGLVLGGQAQRGLRAVVPRGEGRQVATFVPGDVSAGRVSTPSTRHPGHQPGVTKAQVTSTSEKVPVTRHEAGHRVSEAPSPPLLPPACLQMLAIRDDLFLTFKPQRTSIVDSHGRPANRRLPPHR